MIEQLLIEIEKLDIEIWKADPAELENCENLLRHRASIISRLSNSDANWLGSELERFNCVGTATESMRNRFQFLRTQAVEDLGLLQRHDQLLHMIAASESNPIYVDYSG